MNETCTDEAYGAADASWQTSGSSAPNGQWPAEMAGETVVSVVAGLAPPGAAPVGSGVHRLAQRPGPAADGAVRLRLVQVYLTPGIDEFLRQARSMAIAQNLDVTASAVVRYAMEHLMATTSPAEMVDLLGSPKGQSQPRRGRPRR